MVETAEPDVVKAICCNINFGASVLDAYMLPDGEKRLGIKGTGISLGYTDRWFYNRTKRESKALKALQGAGFTGAQLEVRVLRRDKNVRGSSVAKTVSIRDFIKLVTYEAISNGNLKAVILLGAFAETGLERILEDAFAGRSIEFILEKIIHYTKWTYEELEEVLRYNREEVRALYFGKGWELSDRKSPNL